MAPDTLLEYFPHDAKGKPQFLTVIDESHVTLPQLHGMYKGDYSRAGKDAAAQRQEYQRGQVSTRFYTFCHSSMCGR